MHQNKRLGTEVVKFILSTRARRLGEFPAHEWRKALDSYLRLIASDKHGCVVLTLQGVNPRSEAGFHWDVTKEVAIVTSNKTPEITFNFVERLQVLEASGKQAADRFREEDIIAALFRLKVCNSKMGISFLQPPAPDCELPQEFVLQMGYANRLVFAQKNKRAVW
ncbi:MAG TPA: hypothetical protein VLA04_02595 [Verrucomicrobiae bacterium]|nr:hypothetical protein [Verrucomicrobiae bacterium]